MFLVGTLSSCRASGIESRPSLPDTHTPTPAREKSLTFFAFEQQQMGNWPTNCCNDLGLPISARSSTIPEPVQARMAPDVCIRAMLEQLWYPVLGFANVAAAARPWVPRVCY
jgi:hypothetical protein